MNKSFCDDDVDGGGSNSSIHENVVLDTKG